MGLRRSRARRTIVGIALLGLHLVAREVDAQDIGAPSGFEALMRAAYAASNEGRLDDANRAARRALILEENLSLRALIARNEAALGHWEEAYNEASRALMRARVEAPSEMNAHNLDVAERVARAARRRVAVVTLVVATPTPTGLGLTIAGRLVSTDECRWGCAVPPGVLRIEATAAGVAERFVEEVAAGERVIVRVAAVQSATPSRRFEAFGVVGAAMFVTGAILLSHTPSVRDQYDFTCRDQGQRCGEGLRDPQQA